MKTIITTLLFLPFCLFSQIFNDLHYSKSKSLYPKTSTYSSDYEERETKPNLKTKLIFSGFYKYQRDNGSTSEYYQRDFEFTTGEILNIKTHTLDYKQDVDYALIWYNQDEVAVIELDKKIFSANTNRYGFTESDYNCVKLVFSILNPISGKSQSGKIYTFCMTDYNICPCN
ncbi:MAG: hypothetical protein K0S26_1093 [Bacteroidota bacterium]|jgi:hypothetical protein|nr:hypothetical protein [Bacteroidota bacterium]